LIKINNNEATKKGKTNLLFVIKQIGSSLFRAANGFKEVCLSNNICPILFNFSKLALSWHKPLLELSPPFSAVVCLLPPFWGILSLLTTGSFFSFGWL